MVTFCSFLQFLTNFCCSAKILRYKACLLLTNVQKHTTILHSYTWLGKMTHIHYNIGITSNNETKDKLYQEAEAVNGGFL